MSPFSTATLAALLLVASPLRAQEDLVPQVYITEIAGSYDVNVMASPLHAGGTAFVVLSRFTDPETALADGHVLVSGTLDQFGLFSAPLQVPAPVLEQKATLVVVVMDGRADLVASRPVALPKAGGGWGFVNGQENAITCLYPPPPACSGGQLPDLVITNIALNTANTSTSCTGAALPWVGCPDGTLPGGRSFTATATIRNDGTCAVPCKTNLSVKWGTGPSPGGIVFEANNQTVKISDLLPGATVNITRSFWMGPCETPVYNVVYFGAIVDPLNTIAELVETNNAATPVAACNFD